MKNTAFERITKMLENAHTDEAVFSHTFLYRESWMLRIVLSFLSEGLEYPPLTFQNGARWFSEAQIKSPFHLRAGETKKDKEQDRQKIAEGPTSMDGVIGHFGIRPGTKVGFQLAEDANQFVVIEAKISSDLTAGVDFAPDYGQAARIVACMTWAIGQSDRSASDFDSLGFYLIAPNEQLNNPKKSFSELVNESSIRKQVKDRVKGYAIKEEIYEELLRWYEDIFNPILKHIDVKCISWESILTRIDDDSVDEFYKRCLDFN